MRKTLLFLLMAVFVTAAYGQKIDEGFESGEIPAEWTIHDYGYNPSTWKASDYSPYSGTYHIEVDCYEADSTESGRADDWIITPKITVNTGDVISVWATSSSSSYPDGFEIRAATAGTDTADFDIHVADFPEVPSAYTKYKVTLTAIDGIADGDEIYLGIHAYTNGSYLNMDDIYVGEPQLPKMQNVYATGANTVDVEFDMPLAASDLEYENFTLEGATSITFDTAYIDAGNNKMVHLEGASAAMANDTDVDSLIYNTLEDTAAFYAGIMPMEYTSTTNPGGLISEDYSATYTGIVVDKGGSETLWISEESAARKTIMAYGAAFWDDVAVGDSIMLYGYYSPYQGQSELYEPNLISVISEGNALPEPVNVTAADVSWNVGWNEDPAEQYENVTVRLENVVVYDSLTNSFGDFYFFAHSESGADTFRIGDRFGIMDEGFSGELFTLNETYNLNGIVIGQYGEWHVAPRNLDDIESISDSDKPTVSNDAQTVTNASGQYAMVSSNEAGTVYIVEENADQASVSDLEAAVDAYHGAKANVNGADAAEVSTAGLMPGTYYAYAVDLAGNLSDKGANAITVESSALHLPYEEDFEASPLIPDNIMLMNEDQGTPASSLELYANLADSAFIVVNTDSLDLTDFGEDNRIALGTSWYDEEVDADDWMVLPKMMLGPNSELTWTAMSLTVTGDYPDDYTVYLSTTTPEAEEFEPIYEVNAETFSADADSPGDGPSTHSVMLADSGYADQEVYIAFRLNTPYPGGDRLGLDDIIVAEADMTAPTVSVETQTANVGDDIMVQSSEGTGKVYLVLDGEPQATVEELETAVTNEVAAAAQVTAADTDIPVATGNLLAGTYYAYAVDSAMNMSAKSTNAVTLEAASAIEDVLHESKVAVYPNPAGEQAFVALKLNKPAETSLSVFDLSGRKIQAMQKGTLSQGEHKLTLDVSSLRAGSYFLKLRVEDRTMVKKLIVR